MRKFSLLFAAAIMAFAMQTAWAEDEDIPPEEEIAEASEDAGSFVGRWRSRGDRPDGPHMGRWQGGRSHGPMMRHPGPPCIGPGCGPMMSHGDKGRRFGHRGGMRDGMFGPRFMEELDLTDAQKGKLVDVLTENFRNRMLARIEMHDAIAKMRELDKSDNPDHDAIIAANAALGTARGKMDVLERKLKEQVRGVLTPEQVKKLDERTEKRDQDRDEWRKDRRERRKDRDGRPGPGPRDPKMQRGPGPRVQN